MSTIIRLKRKCSSEPLDGFFVSAKSQKTFAKHLSDLRSRAVDDRLKAGVVGDVRERENVEHVGKHHFLFRYAGSSSIASNRGEINFKEITKRAVKKAAKTGQTTCRALKISAEYERPDIGTPSKEEEEVRRKRKVGDVGGGEVYLQQKRHKCDGDTASAGGEGLAVRHLVDEDVVRVYDVEQAYEGGGCGNEVECGGSAEDQYRYDIYHVKQDMVVSESSDGTDPSVCDNMYITPFYGDLMCDAGNASDSDDAHKDIDDSDSNDENNWRNDYPDRDIDGSSESESSDDDCKDSDDAGAAADELDDDYLARFDHLNLQHDTEDDEGSEQTCSNFQQYKKRLLRELKLENNAHSSSSHEIDRDNLHPENYGLF